MILLVGLGNPGDEHRNNRHNVGFMAADLIWERYGFGPWRERFKGELAEGRLGSQKCLVLKPLTYMNESGQAVGETIRFYKIPLDDIVIFHDELDLAPGKLKVKTGGGHAGNNGLRSVIRHIGADFRRVRIGIGHPGQKDLVSKYVLKDFAKDDAKWLDPLLAAIADAAPRLAVSDDARFTTDVALATGSDERRETKKKKKTQEEQSSTAPTSCAKTHTDKEEPSRTTALAEKLKTWTSGKNKDNG